MIAKIRTKNHSASPLRGKIYSPFRTVVRLGSTTTTDRVFPSSVQNNKRIIEINTVDAIENSRNKLRMKECFKKAEVPQSDWFEYLAPHMENGACLYNLNALKASISLYDLPYPILAKRINGFKGHGMVKLDNQEQLEQWLSNNSTNGYYFEAFMNYAREYRIHCTQSKVFMSWRKLRKSDTPEDRRWFFNSENCNWVSESHELFDRPTNWDAVTNDCLKAIKAVGLDIGSFDVRVQSSKNKNPLYIIIEVNSAPSLGDQGVEIYKKEIQSLIYKKC